MPQTQKKSAFLGPAYTEPSAMLSLNQCINLYPEIIARETPKGTTKEVGALVQVPGISTAKVTLATSPVRPGGLHIQGATNLFVVSGNKLYLVNGSYSPTTLGTLGTSSGPVQMMANHSQVGVVDGTSNIYVYNYVIPSFSTVALPSGAPANACCMLNEFGLVNQTPATKTIWQSNLNDLTTWNPLNFAAADSLEDYLVGFAELHNQLYVFKERHIEVWANAGVAGFTFQRIPGVLPEVGCINCNTIAKAADSLLWLGQDQAGAAAIYRINGYEAKRVSTYAIDTTIAAYRSQWNNAFAMTYMHNGHSFYIITWPGISPYGVSWCLDLTATDQLGYPIWHQRAGWSTFYQTFTQFTAAYCAAPFGPNGLPVIGDYYTGALYELDPTLTTDSGFARRWLRSWRANPVFDMQDNPIRCLEIQYDSQGASGNFNLRKSTDGTTWSTQSLTAAFGPVGKRARFNRLGSSMRGAQSDWVFELSSTDPALMQLQAAWINQG